MKAFTLVLLCLDVLALVVATLVFAVWTLYPGGILSLYLLLPIPLIAFAGYFWFQTTFKSIDWFTRHGDKDRRPLFASAALASYIGVIALICLVKAAFLGLYFLLSAPAGDAFFQPYQGAFGLPAWQYFLAIPAFGLAALFAYANFKYAALYYEKKQAAGPLIIAGNIICFALMLPGWTLGLTATALIALFGLLSVRHQLLYSRPLALSRPMAIFFIIVFAAPAIFFGFTVPRAILYFYPLANLLHAVFLNPAARAFILQNSIFARK